MSDELDKKDIEILKRLKNDSRIPMGVIGDQIGISKATVSRRVARLEDENIIKNYSDWTLKGVKYKTYSVIGLDLGIGLKVTGKRVFFMSAEDPERIASLLPKEEKE